MSNFRESCESGEFPSFAGFAVPFIFCHWILQASISSHKDREALHLQEEAGVKVRLLPAYLPDYNPIDLMWSKVKALPRKAGARTPMALLSAIDDSLERVTSKDATHWFAYCG
ncbi:MAG: hypothetical protein QM680_09950 [Luteolibacter sp.]